MEDVYGDRGEERRSGSVTAEPTPRTSATPETSAHPSRVTATATEQQLVFIMRGDFHSPKFPAGTMLRAIERIAREGSDLSHGFRGSLALPGFDLEAVHIDQHTHRDFEFSAFRHWFERRPGLDTLATPFVDSFSLNALHMQSAQMVRGMESQGLFAMTKAPGYTFARSAANLLTTTEFNAALAPAISNRHLAVVMQPREPYQLTPKLPPQTPGILLMHSPDVYPALIIDRNLTKKLRAEVLGEKVDTNFADTVERYLASTPDAPFATVLIRIEDFATEGSLERLDALVRSLFDRGIGAARISDVYHRALDYIYGVGATRPLNQNGVNEWAVRTRTHPLSRTDFDALSKYTQTLALIADSRGFSRAGLAREAHAGIDFFPEASREKDRVRSIDARRLATIESQLRQAITTGNPLSTYNDDPFVSGVLSLYHVVASRNAR